MISIELFSYALQIPLWVVLILGLATVVLGAGRLTRIIYYDAFPPAAWFRAKWDDLTKDSSWNLLMHCPWCLGPWVTLVAILTFIPGLSVPWLGFAWWLFWGWLALSYIVTMIIVRDEPEE